jgi:hypothetical protein
MSASRWGEEQIKQVTAARDALDGILGYLGGASLSHDQFEKECLEKCLEALDFAVGRKGNFWDAHTPRDDIALISSGLLAAILRFARLQLLTRPAVLDSAAGNRLDEALTGVEQLEADTTSRG